MNERWMLALLWLAWPLGAASSIFMLRSTLTKSPTALPRAGARGFGFGVASSALLSVVQLTFGFSISLALLAFIMGAGAAFLAISSAFLVRTSIRIQELRKAGEGGLKSEFIAAESISATQDYETRLQRLVNSGYLQIKDGKVQAPPSTALIYARSVRALRNWILQQDY